MSKSIKGREKERSPISLLLKFQSKRDVKVLGTEEGQVGLEEYRVFLDKT